MLLGQDAGGQRLLGVVGRHRHRRLQHDRPAVHTLVREVHGGAGDLHAVLEGLALGVQAGKRGQERGMDVEASAGEGPDVDRGQDPHVAGLAHEPDLPGLELAHERQVEGLAIGEVLGVHPERLHAGRPRALESQ